MKNLLLSERWRPKKIEDCVILPRIHKIFQNGITQNLILCGSYGTGKTTLSRILIGKYLKNKPFMEINGSLYTSIDVLRTKIDDFCSRVYMGLDLLEDIDQIESTKYVFIDECDRLSIQFQDALKAYIEEYSTKDVRFLFTTNHINKVSPGILSRLRIVNFDCESVEEEKILKNLIAKRISTVICPTENINIDKSALISIINKNFPDFRSMMNDIQVFKETGEISNISNLNLKLRNDLYNIVYDPSCGFERTYHFLMDNFGPEKIDLLFQLFGSHFIKYSLSEKKEDIDSLFDITHIVSEYSLMLEGSTDPIVLGMSFLGKIKNILCK